MGDTPNLSADPRDHEPRVPKWVHVADREVAAWWLAKIRDQLTAGGEPPKNCRA